MLEKFDMKLLSIAFVIIVLLCAGIYFYAEWSNKRFASELGKPPQLTVASEPSAEIENDTVSRVEQTTSIKPLAPVSENAEKADMASEQASMETSGLPNGNVSVGETETPKPASEFDATPLLSAFGLPEEVTTLFDEDADAADFEEAEAYLVEEYGQSPEVEAIIDKLKQLSGGPVELDVLTGLFEAWIQVLPPEDQENRRQLMNVIAQLNQAKALGGTAEVSIQVHVESDVRVVDDD